ncbi:MAG TPA: phosphoenolpyruvate carboxykinase (ATP) [Vicinamibacterales bacterium]|nr:phosphoenolpyruvate carboxykinase (ATP) [Vicinamibacterales bacterium]
MSIEVGQLRDLRSHGIMNSPRIWWNLPAAVLYEEAVRRHEGLVADAGPLVCRTGQHTGRSPNDKFFVYEPSSASKIWWGANRPLDEAKFDGLHRRMLNYLDGRELFVQDCYGGADAEYRLPIRVITEYAWHSLFARNLFINEHDPARLASHQAEFVVLCAPGCRAVPSEDGTNSETFIVLNLAKKIVLIGGTQYAGEIKKSIFTVLNYLLPLRDVLSMHCSANIGPGGDVALFFGLSGTGKTTLSSDPARRLIGDDEHGWSDRGVFNFEGGCYAKTIRLSPEAEPEIYSTTRRFGTVLENVVIDPATRALNLDDEAFTENTRAAYPISFIANAELSGQGGHPSNVVLLTADAFGVMPPIARLTPEAARYHFISGYTAKVAGTEKGVTEPKATFSTCFAAPFLPLPPTTYSRLLGERIVRHNASVWLVNTGWTGGAYGTGRRMKIGYTRAMVRAALSGQLDGVHYELDPVFNVEVPTSCPDVPSEVLRPRNTWTKPDEYDIQARKLARMFIENFKKFDGDVPADVIAAGPRV